MKPDIVINKDKENCIVLDTKWKNINGYNPSPEDLRQMFVYMKYYKAIKVALVYPGSETIFRNGKYFDVELKEFGIEECSLITLGVERDVRYWQNEISESIHQWVTNRNDL